MKNYSKEEKENLARKILTTLNIPLHDPEYGGKLDEISEILGKSGRDITDEQSGSNLSKFRMIYENSRDGIVFSSVSGNIIECNKVFSDMLGYAPDELKRMNFFDLTPQRWHQWEKEEILGKRLEIKGYSDTYEKEYIHKNGEVFPVEITAYKSYDPVADKTFYWGIARDITERKKYESELIRLNKRYEAMLSSFPNGAICLYDENIRFKAVAGEILDRLGLNSADLIGKTLEETFPAKIHKLVRPHVKKLFSGEHIYFEVDFRGHTLANWGVPVKDEAGNVWEGLNYILDITELKNKEKQLQEAKLIAEESDRLKSVFMTNMSHELRTPLNAVIGFSELINRDMPIEEILEMNRTINESGRKLLKIIQSIIEFTVLEGKVESIKMEAQPIGELTRSIIFDFESEFAKKEQEGVSIELPDEMTASKTRIRTDKVKFKLLIQKLLDNALKFTSSGKINFNVMIDDSDFVVEVKDTGPGISADKQKLIFERFRQLDQGATRKFGGIGLGLAISKKIADLLGGDLELESRPGEGSLFRLRLKDVVLAEDLPAEKDASAKLNDFSHKTILVAEDEDSNYQLLRLLLAKLGISVVRARNGKEAVEMVKSPQEIHLVLMDIKMPEMNGYEATKIINEIAPDIPVIAQTAYSMEEDVEKALAAGCSDHISKPISSDNLRGILEKHLK